mmetsp:Transcript_29347/g.65111  ORF Transcript_29347/g.65111 Transcript_29347/m.65111 type:complete len:343 (+) Transcript_29347:213-1241(+)
MIEITQPDDFHHHLRDGEGLKDVTVFAAKAFGRVVAMPNLNPPVRTLSDALAYRARILSHLPEDTDFTPLMTLYLTDETTREQIVEAKMSGVVWAAKLYPAGATTNSQFGVTDVGKIDHVLMAMSEVGMLLLLHGEVNTPTVDIFDREKVFIDTILIPLVRKHPTLKVVMEHITTEDAVQYVLSAGPLIAATITAHHLLYNRNALFKGGLCPHLYCLPVLKRERHRLALVEAATSGNPKFFIGTDSAPHTVEAKHSACGCAGVFTGHAPLELYAEAFDSVDRIHRLDEFCGKFGQLFYGLPRSEKRVVLVREAWEVPARFQFGNSEVVALRAGESIAWKVVR